MLMSRTQSVSSDAPDRNQLRAARMMPVVFLSHYRCPADLFGVGVAGELSSEAKFFKLGEMVCYGRLGGGPRRPLRNSDDVSDAIVVRQGGLDFPFDLSEVVTNLQQERYAHFPAGVLERLSESHGIRSLYYLLRPLLTLSVRRQLQRLSLHRWNRIAFPRWPVDFTVETLLEFAMRQILQCSGLQRVPFIWFWPDGAPSCAIMTHD